MRCRRYLHAVFWIAACSLFSIGSLILQGCGDAPVEPKKDATPPAAKEEPVEQKVTKLYAELDAKYPQGRPKELTVEERYADPTYEKTLSELKAKGDQLKRTADDAKAKADQFAKALIEDQNRRLKAAGYELLNETLKANVLAQSKSYQELLSQAKVAEEAVAEHQKVVHATITAQRKSAQVDYDKKLLAADESARAAGLPTRSELLKAQPTKVAK